jgi:hypothetical protein
MLFITEVDIQQVMAETGMEHIQARRHLECRRILQQRSQYAHAQRIDSLIDRMQDVANAPTSGNSPHTTLCLETADPITGALTSSVKHADSPQK